MSPASSPQTLALFVVWGGVLIGVALGALAQATRFCTMGALADWLGFGSTGRLTMWALAVAVAAVASAALVAGHALDPTRTLAWSERFLWLSNAVGGTLFGVGMVLASGCPQRNLVRAGSGSLKALVTLLVVALTAQMTLRGLLAEPRVRWLDAAGVTLTHPQDLGSMLAATGLASAGTWRVAALVLLLAFAAWLAWRSRADLDAGHWVGGIGVGALVCAAWWLTGSVGYLTEHPETLEPAWLGTASRRPEGLSFAAPLAQGLDLLTLWSDRNTTPSYSVMVVAGVLLGSAVSALWRREFRVEGFRDASDLGSHLIGAMLMGFGGVTALGCSIGQGITGMSLLSSGACIALAGMVAGTALALKLQAWRIQRSA